MPRIWTDPRIVEAEEDVHTARQVVARAETRLEHVQENRRRQLRDESQIRMRGLEPWYRPRAVKPSPDDLHAEMSAHLRVVRFWASDEELDGARRELAEAETGLETAMAAFEEAKKNLQPLDEKTQLAKAKRSDGYLALRTIRLSGKTYRPGEVVAGSAVEDVPWPKVNGWLTGRNPTLRKV